MSAVPENIPELWKAPQDAALASAVLANARQGLVVLAQAGVQLDASIHALLTPSLLEFAELEQIAHDLDKGNAFAVRPGNCPVLVLHTSSLGLDTCGRIIKAMPSLMPVVLVYEEETAPDGDLVEQLDDDEQIVARIRNNENAGQAWADFCTRREDNNGNLIVLDFIDKASAEPLKNYLEARRFQVVTACKPLATTFSRSPNGSQLLILEARSKSTGMEDYLNRLRLSHESDSLGILVSGDIADPALRCALLESGADDLLDARMSNDEIMLRLQTTARQQTRAQQIRGDAYRFPGSVAYNADFLVNVGNKLYASAQRDVMTMALAMVRVNFVQNETTAMLSSQERAEVLQLVANYCTRNLRETDLFAQCGERDFIALVTCVGRNNITRVFKRLSEEVVDLVDSSTEGRASVQLNIGATPELGVSFKSMMARAQQALVKAENETDTFLIVN